MEKNLFSKRPRRMLLAMILAFLFIFAFAVLISDRFRSENTSSSMYMAEIADSGRGTGMPASFSKAASVNSGIDTEEIFADGDYVSVSSGNSYDSVDLTQEAVLSQSTRKLIRTVNMNLETQDFDELIKNISDLTASVHGYIEQSDISGNSLNLSGERSRRYSNITLRIPADNLDHFLTEVSNQGNVTYRSENVQDVTLQYTDITSRQKTLQTEQERLWELLEKADSVDSIIALESRLSEVRYQLESLESQLRTLDNQIVYSTVSLSIQEVQVLTATEPDSIPVRIQKGLSHSLNGLAAFSIDFFVWFVSSLPVLVVLVIFISVIVLILRKIRKKIRKGRAEAAQDENK